MGTVARLNPSLPDSVVVAVVVVVLVVVVVDVVVVVLVVVVVVGSVVVVVSSNSTEICFVLPPPLALLFFLKAEDTGWVEVIKLMRVVVVVIRLTSLVLVVVSRFRFSFSLNLAVSIIKSFSPFKRRRPDLELVFIFLNLFLDFLEIRFRIVGRKLSFSKLKPFSVTKLFGLLSVGWGVVRGVLVVLIGSETSLDVGHFLC